ncbi:MAG: hypothetical protein E4G90_04565 [Gemmatimonadales bacterium]|nr:MAG: hypothetical protein E4G90_04565 [Gemmatimonadales bacterium]
MKHEELFNLCLLKVRLGEELDRAIEAKDDGMYIDTLLAADVALILRITREKNRVKRGEEDEQDGY